jgi:hypothetical protein
VADHTLRITGYREFLRACDHAGKDVKRETRGAFKKVGEIVRLDMQQLFAKYDARSAAGYRTYVRLRGIDVEQSLGKVTGRRPDYADLQVRKAAEPAVADKENEVLRAFDHALGTVSRRFEREG